MIRILLIKSRSLVSKVKGTSPPLGLMYLAAYLRQQLPAGAQVRIADVKFMAHPEQQIGRLLSSFRPHVLGISALNAEAHVAHLAARLARRFDPGLPVIIGGPGATSDPAGVLQDPNIDAAVVGEGELTFHELVRLIQEQGPGWSAPDCLGQVRGVAYRDADGQLALAEQRPYITDLDALPFPAWDLIDVQRYWKLASMANIGVRPYMSIFTSRGCPFRCAYCQHMFGRRFRHRSVDNVLAEIKEIRARLGVADLELLDDIANFDAGRLNGILRELQRQGLPTRLSFPNGVRTDLLQEETIRLLAELGPGEVSVAVETASPRLQKLLKKNLDLSKVWDNIELLARHRIPSRGFFMMGFPGETEAELRSTVDFACDSRLHLALFFTVTPHQDTELYRLFAEQGRLPEEMSHIDWEYHGAPFNGSDVPDALFRKLYRQAYWRFYADPRRIYRIVRDRPYYADLPGRVWTLFHNLSSFRRLEEK